VGKSWPIILLIVVVVVAGILVATKIVGLEQDLKVHEACMDGMPQACQLIQARRAVEGAEEALETAKKNLAEAEQAYRRIIAPPTVTSDGQ